MIAHHIADRLKAVDEFSLKQIPAALLNKTIEPRNKMLALPKPLIFLHDYLHHDNILKHVNEWLSVEHSGCESAVVDSIKPLESGLMFLDHFCINASMVPTY